VVYVVVHISLPRSPLYCTSALLSISPIIVLSVVRLYEQSTPPNRSSPLKVGSSQCVSTHRPGSVLPVQPTCGRTSGLLRPLADISALAHIQAALVQKSITHSNSTFLSTGFSLVSKIPTRHSSDSFPATPLQLVLSGFTLLIIPFSYTVYLKIFSIFLHTVKFRHQFFPHTSSVCQFLQSPLIFPRELNH